MTGRFRLRSWRTAAVFGLFTAALVACTATTDPESTPTNTGPYPAADIAPLTPADVTPALYEDTTAVQVLRTTITIIAWANLTDTNQFAQFTRYIDPNSKPGAIGISDFLDTYPYVNTGPQPIVIVSVTDNPDGTTTVGLCSQRAEEVDKNTGAPHNNPDADEGMLLDATLSPLTDDEIAELEALDLEPPPLRVRDYIPYIGLGCDHSTATVQHFENWREHAPIGDYNLRDPNDVIVLDEETPRAREEMP